MVHKNIGSYYRDLKEESKAAENFEMAHSFLNRSLMIREQLAAKKGIMEVYNGMGDVFRRQKNLKAALQYTEDYLALAEELDHKKFIKKAYKDLSRVYADLNNYKKLVSCGANVLVAGNTVFGSKNPTETISLLKKV